MSQLVTYVMLQHAVILLLYLAAVDELSVIKMKLKNIRDWKILGRGLGLSCYALEKIALNCRDETVICIDRMLTAWWQQKDSPKRVPSLSVLQEALEKMEEFKLAKKISW